MLNTSKSQICYILSLLSISTDMKKLCNEPTGFLTTTGCHRRADPQGFRVQSDAPTMRIMSEPPACYRKETETLGKKTMHN